MFPIALPPPIPEVELHGQYDVVGTSRMRGFRGGVVLIWPHRSDWNGMMLYWSTTATEPEGAYFARQSFTSLRRDQTVADLPRVEEPAIGEDIREISVPAMLAEIKRLTGWSWEALAGALSCSRQAVHAWTLGKEIKQDNLDRLSQLHATVRYIDRGDSDTNRVLLAQASKDGRTVTQLLEACEFEAVRELVGQGQGRPRAEISTAPSSANVGKLHWFDRVAAAAGGEADPELEFISRGEGKRLKLRKG